jgi:glycosyltransferase involved in cell wall biosynthesis
MLVKLLQVVWNFPETVKQPFNMYYFYWPLHEATSRGWEVEVLTFQVNKQQRREEVIDGIRVQRCPAGVRKGKPFSWPFLVALFTTDADIIICHGYGEGRSELAILLGRLRGRKVVFVPHFHLYPYRRVWREWYDKTIGRFFFNCSGCVVVFTEYTHQQLLQLGVKPEKLRVVPHVARPDVFTCTLAQQPESLLRQAGIAGVPLLLGVGQLIARKGWEYTVRCLPAIVARFPDVQLLIAGPSQPAEPDFHRSLLRLAKDLKVADHLHIVQDNTPEFMLDAYRSATILTHPSFVESFGLVLLEAMTAGLPVIAHNGTGIPCIVEDGVTGYVVDVRDVQKYTALLLAVLEDSLLRQRMGEAGKRRAATYFSQARSAETLFKIFAELTPARPSVDNSIEA